MHQKPYDMKLHLWLLIVSYFASHNCCNSFAIPDFSPLYSQPFIYGPDDFQNGSVIGLACNLTREEPEKEIPKYTFVLMKNEKCQQIEYMNLDANVTYSKDGLFLRYRLDPLFKGKKSFACVLKSNYMEPPPGCHTVHVGLKPGKPSVSCVSHGFRHIRCAITPSSEELKNFTGLILPRHNFSDSYQLVLNDENKISCNSDSKSACRYLKNGVLIYDIPDFMYIVTFFKVQITLKNLFGETKVTQFFNMCQIEQPVIGKIRTSKEKSTSIYLNWTVVDSLLPTDKEYFQSIISCTSKNSHFRHTSFKLVHFFDNLQPFTLYDCEIRTRSKMNTKNGTGQKVVCFGEWSEPKSVSFRTRPSAPNVGPVATRGTILKHEKSCQLHFFEIPNDKRNGIVNSYRISLLPVSSHQKPMFTEFLNPSFDCSRSIKFVNISGKTNDCHDCWSPDSKVDFRLVSKEHVDIELWKSTPNRYQTVAKFSKELEISDAFLAVCNCSNTCHKSNFHCRGMRRIKHPNPTSINRKSNDRASLMFEDETFSLREEKVSVHLTFRKVRDGQLAYAMSEWISCAYDRESNFTMKFPDTETIIVNRDQVSLTFKGGDLACSPKIIKPVYKIFTRVTCDGKLFKEFNTPKRSLKRLTVPVVLEPYKSCEVEMSLDNKAFVQKYKRADSSKYISLLIVAVIFVVLLMGIVLCCYRYNQNLKSYCKTIFETKTTKVLQVNEPMSNQGTDPTFSKDYNGGYYSVEPANTTAETGHSSSEGYFPEQGVTHDITASTRLIEGDSSDFNGYIDHESNVDA